MKKKIFLLFLTIFITSFDTNSQVIEENGEIENGIYKCKLFDWQIKIPDGYEIRLLKVEQDLEEIGYNAAKENLPNGVKARKNRPYLVGFEIDESNYFSSSFEPLEGTKKMTLSEHQEFIANLIKDTYSDIKGIKSDQQLDNKKIGEYDFYIIKERIYNEKTDELLLTQLIYNTYVKNHLFSISINYSSEYNGKILIENFEQSLTK